jgi:hypothetical protein
MIYLIAALTNSIFWFRLVLAGFHAVNVVYFWLLSKQLIKRHFAKLATITFAIISSLPIVEGNIANAELFMIVPATIGIYLLYKTTSTPKPKPSLYKYLTVGLLFSVAFLFKVPIVFDFVSVLAFWVFFAVPKVGLSHWLKKLFSKELLFILIGFLSPVLLSIFYYFTQGALKTYVESALLQNAGYIFSWGGNAPGSQPLLLNPLVWRLMVIGLVFLYFLFNGNKLSKPLIFTSLWTLFSTYGSLLSNRPYPHYLIQPLVPFSLLIFIVISQRKLLEKLTGFIVCLIVVGMLAHNGFWYYSSLPYYQRFVRLVTGQITPLEYRDSFKGAKKNYAIAEYIKNKTTLDDKIFVWGTEPSIYSLSDRRPVGRYVVSFHIRDFPNGFEETIAAIESHPPKFIIVFNNQVPEFRQLEAFIENHYSLIKTIDDGQIYLLINP